MDYDYDTRSWMRGIQRQAKTHTKFLYFTFTSHNVIHSHNKRFVVSGGQRKHHLEYTDLKVIPGARKAEQTATLTSTITASHVMSSKT
jgi:hypothetical protein